MIKSGRITVKRNAVKQLSYFKQKAECKGWIELCLDRDLGDLLRLEDTLCDGVVLLELMNKISPGSVTSVQKTIDKFKMMQNATVFLDATQEYGVNIAFAPDDLVNKRHEKVIACIRELALVADRKGFETKMPTIDIDNLDVSGAETIKKISTEYKLDVDVQQDTVTPEKVELNYREPEIRMVDFGTNVYIPEERCVIL